VPHAVGRKTADEDVLLDAMPAPPTLVDAAGTIAFSVAFDYPGKRR